jgi:hypothetical protein
MQSQQQDGVMKTLPLLLLVFVCRCVAAPVAITTTSLPNGTLQTAYSAAIDASGGCKPYKWAIPSGALPSGLKAQPSSSMNLFQLTGDPTAAGSYSFTVSVTACGGHVSKASYKVVIQAGANHVVDLSWKASTSSEITGYNIYRSPDAKTWSKINSNLIASTVYSDATVANSTTYYYAATAVDVEGEESGKTAAVKVAVP